ncbi:MAG: acyl-CoA dehydrogenase family protein [Vicinamibacterales bacterium]
MTEAVRRLRAGVAPFDAGHEAFRASVRRFVAQELTPHAHRWERSGRFPRRALASCGRRGYLDLDASRTAVLAEELAACDSMGVALSIFVQAGLVGPLVGQLGTVAQKRRWLAPLRAGRCFGALAVTEPGAGSDFAGLTCRATAGTGGFAIDGEKTYITNAAAADFLVVAARLGPRPDADLTLFVVPADARGVRVTPLAALGLGPSAMGRISFTKCRLPVDAMLGESGAAYGYIQDALNRERLFGGIGAVACAARALEKTAAFLKTRRAFGRTLSRFQTIRHQLADHAAALEAARQLNYATFVRWLAGEDVTKEIAMIKLFGYRQAQLAIETCLQMHGGLGFLADHWTSRWYRDARALTIAAGTPEVMREIIAAHLRL